MVFVKSEYDIFNKENMIRNDSSVRDVRKGIKEKLLGICDDINDKMNDMGLYHHKNKEHIVSLLMPCEFNHGKVNWIGIRYGKHSDIIEALNFGASKDDIYGFQKHNCFQLDVCKSGIEMGLFHAVPNGSVDRMYCHQKIDEGNTEFITKLENAINNIVGYGFVWNIGVEGIGLDGFSGDCFDFDEVDGNVGKEFIKWYSKVDCEGRYSSCLVKYSMYDERIIDVEGVEREFFKVVSRLRDVYDVMCWR